MRIQWRYQPCPCLLAGGLASIWEAVSPLFSTFLIRPRRLKREERLLPIAKLTPLLADTDMADNATGSSLVASRGLMYFLQILN